MLGKNSHSKKDTVLIKYKRQIYVGYMLEWKSEVLLICTQMQKLMHWINVRWKLILIP